ncbi:MAG: U3 small nucleolar RNA-associated protein 13 [Peltula sp. TS41687]|nr:MAG: U3 small nucleolar RNA-associated protein 13 [Peltula sp. TS41687]
MTSRIAVTTTFEGGRVIQPIYTGGSVGLDGSGHILATCLGEDALLTDLKTGKQLARVEGDGEVITSLSITPSASFLILCSRSLALRIYALRSDSDSESDNLLFPELQRTLKPHTTPVITTAVDSTGTLLATGGADGLVKVWDIKGGYTTHTLRGHGGIISALRFFEVTIGGQPSGHSAKDKHKGRHRRLNLEGKEKSELNGDRDPQKGFRLASGGEDGKVRVWDLHTRKCISVLDSHVSVIRGLDYSPEENALVSGSRDKTIIIWDAKSWKSKCVIPVLEGVESTGFVTDGKLAFTGGEHGRVRLWSVSTGREVTQEQPSGNEGESIVDVIHPKGLNWLMSVHGDQALLLHSLQPLLNFSDEPSLPPLPIIRRISGTHDEIIDMAFLKPDKTWLALATNSEDVRIISVATTQDENSMEHDDVTGSSYFGADVTTLKGHEDIVICLDVDWSGQWIATGAKDNTARLWRLDPEKSTFICHAVLTGHAESLGAIALPKSRPSGSVSAEINNPLDHPPPFVLTGSQDQTIKYWNVASTSSNNHNKKSSTSPQARYTRKAHDKDINAIDIKHDSTLFASASQDRTIKIWSVEEGEVQGILRGHRRGVWSIQFAPKDTPTTTTMSSSSSTRGLLLSGSGDKTVKIWNLTDYSCVRTLEGHTNSVLRVVWLPPAPTSASSSSTPRLASSGSDGLVKIWDATSTGEPSCTLDNHTDRIWALSSCCCVNGGADADAGAAAATHDLVSAGADGVLTFWRDTTSSTLAAAQTASSQRIEQEQRLSNYARAGAYREAITLALQLNHPARLLALFRAVVIHGDNNDTPPSTALEKQRAQRQQQQGSMTGNKEVDTVLASLGDEQLLLLLQRVRDWNTNARTAPVAQRILGVLVRSYPVARLVGLRVGGGGGDHTTGQVREGGGGGRGGGAAVTDLLDALRVYTERHYRRLEDLLDESFLVDFTLREMDELMMISGGDDDGGGGMMHVDR